MDTAFNAILRAWRVHGKEKDPMGRVFRKGDDLLLTQLAGVYVRGLVMACEAWQCHCMTDWGSVSKTCHCMGVGGSTLFVDVSGMFRGRFRNVLGTFREILRTKLGSTKQTEQKEIKRNRVNIIR